MPDGHKSIAVSVRIQLKDKTLTEAEIEAIAAAIVACTTKATGATLRSEARLVLKPRLPKHPNSARP